MQRENVVMPKTAKILSEMGQQIKMARLRRNLSVEIVSERAGISRKTLWLIEKGSPSVAMGYYASTLNALNGLDTDLLLIAKDDEFGKKLVELGIASKKRVRKVKNV